MLLYRTTHEELLRTHKRSKSLAKPGTIDPDHELAALWSNIKMFLDAREDDGYVVDLNLLGYFGKKLDEYSKTNFVSDDESIGQMMLGWQEYCLLIADFDYWREEKQEPNKPDDRVHITEDMWLEGVKINGLRGEATAISCCGMLHQSARCSATIDRGHVSGEYGDKLNKTQQKEMMIWCLSRAAQESADSCWVIC